MGTYSWGNDMVETVYVHNEEMVDKDHKIDIKIGGKTYKLTIEELITALMQCSKEK